MTHLFVAAVMLALAFSEAANAQEDSFEHRIERFQLWTGCLPVNLVVEELDQDAKEIGLDRQRIETTVRSRLRSARIFDAEEYSSLIVHVSVNVVGFAFSTHFRFYKYIQDVNSGEYGPAAGWITSVTGTHAGDAGYIISAVSEETDKFIDEYLRVNADSCR